MRAGTIVLTTAILASTAIAGEYPATVAQLDEQTPRPKPDMYQCTANRAVALVEGAKGGKREAVVSKLTQDNQRFWVLLSKRDAEDMNTSNCTSFRPDQNSGYKGEPEFASDMEYWWKCRASYYILVGIHNIRRSELRGDGTNAFHGPGNFPQFNLRNDLTFVHAFEQPPGYIHLEEGQCVPKKYPSDVVWPGKPGERN